MSKELVWVRKPTEKEKEIMFKQPTWDHEAGVWPAHYDEREETFLVIEGGGSITTEDGKVYKFGVGDIVTAERNFDCTWAVENYIKKHYIFNMERD